VSSTVPSRHRCALAIVVLGVFAAGPAGAQRLGESATSTECDAWRSQILAGGAAALEVLTYGNVPACPSMAPEVLASAIRAARPTRDTAYLGRLAGVAGDVRHELVFSAALEVASDKSASTPSRVMSLLVAVAQLGSGEDIPGSTRPQLFTQTLPSAGVCGFGIAGSAALIDAPLPGDAERLAARTIDAIRYDAGEPALLRSLARCARSVISNDIPPQADVTKINAGTYTGRAGSFPPHPTQRAAASAPSSGAEAPRGSRRSPRRSGRRSGVPPASHRPARS
jgi:hypothetical protein